MLQGLFDVGHGTVLDSGTTFTYLPTQAFNQLHTHVSDYALSHGLHTIPGPEPQFQDTCFGGAPSFDETDKLGDFFPSLELYFEVSTEGSGRVHAQVCGLVQVTGLLFNLTICPVGIDHWSDTLKGSCGTSPHQLHAVHTKPLVDCAEQGLGVLTDS